MTVDISPIIDDLRADGYAIKPFFDFFVGPEIARVEVTATPTYPASNLAVLLVSGSMAQVREGYLLEIRTADDTYKGWWNVRFGGSSNITITNLPVRELSRADIPIVAGDIIIIRCYIPLVDKLPAADASSDETAFAPDQLAYVNQTNLIPPIAISGGHYFGTIPAGEASVLVPVAGGGSYTPAAGSTGDKLHSWALIVGDITYADGSTGTDEAPTFEVGAGESVVLHTVTDQANSVIWQQMVYFKVRNATSDPPVDCLIDGDLSSEDRTGWGGQVVVYETLALDTMPDWALACLYCREWYNGVEQSFRSAIAGRSHILLVGYVDQTSIQLTPEGELTFRIMSPLAKLFTLPGFTKALANAIPALNWQQIANLSVLLAFLHIIRWFTSFTEQFDFTFRSVTAYARANRPYPKLYCQKATPGDQVIDLMDAVGVWMVSLPSGAIETDIKPWLKTLAERAAETVNHIGKADYLIEPEAPAITRMTFKGLSLLTLTGISAGLSGNTSVYSAYTGKATGRGSKMVQQQRAIFDAASAQADANTRCGLEGAYQDAVFNDEANDVYEKAYAWTLPLPGGYNIFNLGQYIAIDDPIPNLRNIDVTKLRHWIKGINVGSTSGAGEGSAPVVRLSLMAETCASDAETDTPPASSDLPEYPPISVTPKPPSKKILLTPYDGALPTRGVCLSYSEGAAALITGLSGGTLVFDSWTTGITGSKFYDGCSNPYAYRQLLGISDAGIEYCSDQSAKASFSLLKPNAALFGGSYIGHRLIATIHRNGCFLIATGTNGVVRTDNKFGTVTRVSVNGLPFDPGTNDFANNLVDIAFAEYAPGVVLAVAPTADGVTLGVYISTDFGATWGLLTDTTGWTYDFPKRWWISMPYMRSGGAAGNRNDSGLQAGLYFAGSPIDSYNQALLYANRFGTATSYAGGNYQFSDAGNNHPLSFFTYDANYAYFLDGITLYRSTDGLVTATEVGVVANQGYGSVNSWSSNPLPVIAYSKAIGQGVSVSLDGVTLVNGYPSGWAGGIGHAEFSIYPVKGMPQ